MILAYKDYGEPVFSVRMNRKLEQDERENAVRLESERRKGQRNSYEAADRTADTFEASPSAAAGGNEVRESTFYS